MSVMTQDRLAFLDARFHAHVRTTGRSVVVRYPTGYVMRPAGDAILADEQVVLSQEQADRAWRKAGRSDAYAARAARLRLIEQW